MRLRLFLVSVLLSAPALAEPEVVLERVVTGFSDPLPGGQPGETIWTLSSPSMSGTDFAFSASGTMGTSGLYCYCEGSLIKIVAVGDPAPRAGETFIGFEFTFPELYEGELAFLGDTGASIGVYRWHQGTISVVADHEILIPGGEPGETFPDYIITQPSIDENGILFHGEGEFTEGIYRQREVGASIEVVADTNTEIPWEPGVSFTFFRDRPFTRDGTTVFRGGGPGWSGIVRDSGGGWVPSFSGNEPLPGGEPGEAFLLVSGSVISAGHSAAVFPARGNLGKVGWYRERNGVLELGVDNRTINPLTGIPFEDFDGTRAAAGGERIAFNAGLAFSRTLFLREPDGTYLPIATEGELLEGELVNVLRIHRSSISGRHLGFFARREANDSIFVATVGGGPSVLEIPTQSRWGLMLLALVLGLAGVVWLRS